MDDQAPREERYVSTLEAAELADVEPGVIRQWARRGKLVAVGTVNGVRYYVAAEVMAVEAATRRRPRLQRIIGAVARDLSH